MVMRQMREATKPIMLFTAVAFVALMVFEWGMDITGQSALGVGEIGSVDGTPVMYEEYQAAYQNLYDQAQQRQEEPLSSQQIAEIEDAAFDEVVNQILIRNELQRRGITVTDREISEAAQFSPPAELRPQFTDEQGNLDLASYQQFLASQPQQTLLLLEAYYRDVIPRGKLLRQVSSGIYVSDAELWRRWRDDHETVEIQYVPMDPAARYDDADFDVPDSEIEAYYRANQEEFEIPARATVVAVVLPSAPTAADTAASRNRASAIRQEILDGADFAEVAERESSDQATASRGGDLGVVAGGQTIGPLDSAIFAAPVGTVTEPVRSGYGYHLIRVAERWGADSARASHVLVRIRRTDDSEIALLTRADSLEDMGEAMPLEAAAAELGVEAITVEISRNFPFLVGAGQISEGADWVFEEASPGDVSPVFENAQAFYALELLASEPAGVLPLEDARPAIESTLLFERKMERARAEAEELAARVRAGEALANAASDMALTVRTAGPFTRNDFVPGIGQRNAAIGAAFGLPPGSVSEPVSTPANVYLIQTMSRTPADSLAWVEQRDRQRQTVVSQLQQIRLQEWIEALRSAARIEDLRDEVLRAPDEEPVQLPPVF